MKEVQRIHDLICDKFLKGEISLHVFLIFDAYLDSIKSNPLFKINNN